MQPNSENKRCLGVFTLTMINVAAILSLRNLPLMADVGWTSIFYYAAAGLFFFIPSALVSAELATGWPTRGGVYTWVKEAFGSRWGFLAIWMQWAENIFWYPTILSFTAATIAYLFNPELAENKYYILSMILSMYWLCTIVNLFGMKLSGMVSSIGVMAGTIIPGAMIIVLGLLWVFSGEASQIPFQESQLIPDMTQFSQMSFLVGVILGLMGMEMSAVHAQEVGNPQKDYPKAILLSSFGIMALSILGSLAIAFVVPEKEISLVAGVMQAFANFFARYGLEWMTPILSVMISIGALSMVSTWIIGPTKGLLQTANEGHLPKIMHKTNEHGMPVNILIAQGIVVTVISLAFLFMPSVSSSYWILTDMTAMLYLIMYILMFTAAIRLRYCKPDTKRTYRIPGGSKWGMWLIAGTGLIASIVALVIGFIPPAQLDTGELWKFELLLGGGTIVMVAIPLLIDWYCTEKTKVEQQKS